MNAVEARELEADTLEAAAEILRKLSSSSPRSTPASRTVERALEIMFRQGASERRRTGTVLKLASGGRDK